MCTQTKMPHIHIFTVISFKCHVGSQPAISEHYHCTYFSPFHSDSEPLFQVLALSECCSLIYSYHVWGHKNAGIFIFFVGGIVIFHMCISYLEINALYQVTYGLVPKHVFFLWQLISSSYCNTAGYIHHFFLIYSYLVKKMRMYFSLLDSYHKSKAKAESLNVRPIKPHIHANLNFIWTHFVHFYVVGCVCEGIWILSSVIRPLHQPGFYFYFLIILL